MRQSLVALVALALCLVPAHGGECRANPRPQQAPGERPRGATGLRARILEARAHRLASGFRCPALSRLRGPGPGIQRGAPCPPAPVGQGQAPQAAVRPAGSWCPGRE